jgi:hypothetical protein
LLSRFGKRGKSLRATGATLQQQSKVWAAGGDFPNMPPATGLGVWVWEATEMSRLPPSPGFLWTWTALGFKWQFAYFECFAVKPRPLCIQHSAFMISSEEAFIVNIAPNGGNM